MSAFKSPEDRAKTHEAMVQLCRKENMQITLKGAEPEQPYSQSDATWREPDNIEEIREVFRKVENRKETPLDEFSIPVGKFLPEHIQALGMDESDFRGSIQFSFKKNVSVYGVGHWKKHHDDTLNEKAAIELFRATIWNPLASIKETVKGGKHRYSIYVKDVKSGKLTNVWVVKDTDGKLWLEIIDSLEPDIRYIESIEKGKK